MDAQNFIFSGFGKVDSLFRKQKNLGFKKERNAESPIKITVPGA